MPSNQEISEQILSFIQQVCVYGPCNRGYSEVLTQQLGSQSQINTPAGQERLIQKCGNRGILCTTPEQQKGLKAYIAAQLLGNTKTPLQVRGTVNEQGILAQAERVIQFGTGACNDLALLAAVFNCAQSTPLALTLVFLNPSQAARERGLSEHTLLFIGVGLEGYYCDPWLNVCGPVQGAIEHIESNGWTIDGMQRFSMALNPDRCRRALETLPMRGLVDELFQKIIDAGKKKEDSLASLAQLSILRAKVVEPIGADEGAAAALGHS
jgi:hypothetical protein